MAQRTRIIGAVILIATGLVWIGQATRVLGGGFMVGDPAWAWIGLGAVAGGVFVGWLALRTRPS
jgi:hypothetical protein